MLGSLFAALLFAIAPAPVTDLAVREGVTTQSGIQWTLEVPAFNDSAVAFDEESGEVVCHEPMRLVLAADSITYHWIVWGLPPPYLQEVEDSARVARHDVVTRFYQSRTTGNWGRRGHLTQHWLSRTAAPPQQHYNPGCRRSLYCLIREH